MLAWKNNALIQSVEMPSYSLRKYNKMLNLEASTKQKGQGRKESCQKTITNKQKEQETQICACKSPMCDSCGEQGHTTISCSKLGKSLSANVCKDLWSKASSKCALKASLKLVNDRYYKGLTTFAGSLVPALVNTGALVSRIPYHLFLKWRNYKRSKGEEMEYLIFDTIHPKLNAILGTATVDVTMDGYLYLVRCLIRYNFVQHITLGVNFMKDYEVKICAITHTVSVNGEESDHVINTVKPYTLSPESTPKESDLLINTVEPYTLPPESTSKSLLPIPECDENINDLSWDEGKWRVPNSKSNETLNNLCYESDDGSSSSISDVSEATVVDKLADPKDVQNISKGKDAQIRRKLQKVISKHKIKTVTAETVTILFDLD